MAELVLRSFKTKHMNNNGTSIQPLNLTIDGAIVALPEGQIEDSLKKGVVSTLIDRWPALSGSRDTKMAWEKLFRAENLRIKNGLIQFEIERHASTINGSKGAALHTWEVDLEANCAGIIKETRRQLKPNAKPYTKADAKKSAESVLRILTGRRKNRGELKDDGAGGFIVHASKFADLGEFEQTRTGRRHQFINALKEVLPKGGWCVSAASKWEADIHLKKV